MELPPEAVHRCLARIVRSPSRSTLVRCTGADEHDFTTSRTPSQCRQRGLQRGHEREKVHVEMTLPLGERRLRRANATHGFDRTRIQDKTVDTLVSVLNVLDGTRQGDLIRTAVVVSRRETSRRHTTDMSHSLKCSALL